MADTFQVGEIAILQNCINYPEDNGDECEIVGLPRANSWTNPRSGNWVKPGYYAIYHDGKCWQVRPDKLRKRLPPVKREDIGEWDLCPWRPAKVKANAVSEGVVHADR